MCDICDSIEDNHLSPDQALKVVAVAMKRDPGQSTHLSELIDRVLGTGMEDQDAQANEAWESRKIK